MKFLLKKNEKNNISMNENFNTPSPKSQPNACLDQKGDVFEYQHLKSKLLLVDFREVVEVLVTPNNLRGKVQGEVLICKFLGEIKLSRCI